MNLIEYPDSEMMMIDLANTLAGEIENVLLTEERASFVGSGGSTPGPIYDNLCEADLDWSRVDISISDERWVPETSERSNARLIKERLMVGRAAKANYVPLYATAAEPEDVLDELTPPIRAMMPISVLLLGMGADMHTASLFPGADNLAAALDHNAPPLMAMRAPGAPEPRVTLTAPALTGAMARHLVITGADKREALEKARHAGSALEAPVSIILNGATIHWAEA